MTSLTDTPTANVTMHQVDPSTDGDHGAAISWLEGEFPEWEISLQTAQDGRGQHHPLFLASRDGHHAQSELSPAKLHTRMSDYLGRESRRVFQKN